jgi:ElaB/YqjD/DUF883 family membrane-anchored ribosome-binding protein
MRGANPSATRDEVNELIAEFDENKDGEIQLDEFLVMMGSLFGIASVEEQKAKGDRASTALKKSWRRRQSGHPNLLQSLEQMKTATDDYVNNRQKAYINIGGSCWLFTLLLCHASWSIMLTVVVHRYRRLLSRSRVARRVLYLRVGHLR